MPFFNAEEKPQARTILDVTGAKPHWAIEVVERDCVRAWRIRSFPGRH
jgi:hypothetical protein